MSLHWITPDWPAPKNVLAAATLRAGGMSTGRFASLNLGAHVGDDPSAVAENRARMRAALELPAEPAWLNQVHGASVVRAHAPSIVAAHVVEPPTADASIAFEAGPVCAVLTADCLPVLFCDRAGSRIAAAHAGWRGLAAGVLEHTVRALAAAPDDLLAWFGPAIEQDAFEVGGEVRDQFVARDRCNVEHFSENSRGRWQADLYALARRELARLGVDHVFGGGFRCYADAERFFSYRRDGQTGRMATMIWLSN